MFKDKLKELRKQNNLTQEELAEKLFVSRSAVAKWEQGKGFPNEKSLEDICEMFEVTKEQLYNNQDVIKIVEVVEQSYNKVNKRFFIVSSLALVLFVLIVFFVVLYFEKSKVDYVRDQMFSEGYLEEHYLPGLEQLDGENKILEYGRSYMCTIESKDVFDNYVNYVYGYLKAAPYISRLSYGIIKPTSNDITYKRKYVAIADKLDNFYSYNSLYNTDTYEFYYFAEADKTRQEGDEVVCYLIRLQFGNFTFDSEKGKEQNNFQVFIARSDTLGLGKFYLLEEYYNIHELNVTNTNIDEYIYYSSSLSSFVSSDNGKYIFNMRWWKHDVSYYINVDVNFKIKVQIGYKENGQIKYKEIDKIYKGSKNYMSYFTLTPEDCGFSSLDDFEYPYTKILDVEVLNDSKLTWCTRKFADDSKYN